MCDVRAFDALTPLISLLGCDLVFEGGQQRVSGLTCRKCGASQARDTGAPAITVTPGHYPSRPAAFQCALFGEHYGAIAGLIAACVPEWKDQLALLRKVGSTEPVEYEWTIAEDDGVRCMRPTARLAIDAAVTPRIGNTIKLLKVIAHAEEQVTQLLHDSTLPMRATRIGRHGRPLERWNTRPAVGERNELAEAQQQHRREVEVAIDQELRELRHQKLAAAGL